MVDRHHESEYTLWTGYVAGGCPLVPNNMIGVPKCRGCGKRFNKRDELRIHVRGVFSAHSVPRISRVSFCVDNACIEKVT